MAVKTEDEGNYGVPGDKLLENIIEGTQKERYIEMVRLKIGSPNEVIKTEVLVVSENVASWVRLTPLIGARRVGIFVSETVSWIFDWVWREAI